MDKPFDTDTFIRLIYDEFKPKLDYDDYSIQDAVICWHEGKYIDALCGLKFELVDNETDLEIFLLVDSDGYIDGSL